MNFLIFLLNVQLKLRIKCIFISNNSFQLDVAYISLSVVDTQGLMVGIRLIGYIFFIFYITI